MSSERAAAAPVTVPLAGPVEPMLAFADAVRAAEAGAPAHAPGEICQYVTFFLRDEECAIPILQCREILRVIAITRVPEAPSHVRGIVSLRGHIVPAIDTRQRLGFDSVPPTTRSRMIVVEVAGRLFALLVDRVARILKLSSAAIEPVPAGAARPGATGVARVEQALIHLYDADRLVREASPADPTMRGEAE
jgi:purine-binding chemotaxis protein CheW